jgi:hypothetical protein
MKLHLILLASSLFHLSNGFTATITGPLTEEPCSAGEKSPDFEHCVMVGVAADPHLADHVLTDHFQGGFFMKSGGVRKLQSTNPCTACTGDEPRGTFCFTFCDGTGRRLSPDFDFDAVFEKGAYKGNSKEATDIAKVIIECLSVTWRNAPCFPDTDKMSLTVSL